MGVSGSRMIICRALQKLGMPRKKSPHASEWDTREVREERREFRKEVEPIEPKRLVFVDGTGVTTAMTPAYDRAPRGSRRRRRRRADRQDSLRLRNATILSPGCMVDMVASLAWPHR
jgi:hypothetical protein